MSVDVFLVVIFAAILHATWNAFVKGGKDKVQGMTAITVGQGLSALILLTIFPLPSLESLPYLLVGLCFHLGYQIFLMSAYEIGDFTQVYPIARGTGPLLIALVSIVFLEVDFSRTELAAIFLIVLGIISLAIVRQGDGLRNPKAAMLAFFTGCCIAGYSLADGLGARVSGSAIGFIAMLMFANALIFLAYIRVRSPGTLTHMMDQRKFTMLGGGVASFIAYVLVIWAFTQAPIALVTALRETSIVFAVLIGVIIFKERLNFAKLLATMLSLSGATLLRFGKYLV